MSARVATAKAVELEMNDRVRINEDRIDGRGNCECNANGVGHITRVGINGDVVNDGGSGSAVAGHTCCEGTCVGCHVTALCDGGLGRCAIEL